jgi:hypothetical protein
VNRFLDAANGSSPGTVAYASMEGSSSLMSGLG